MANFCSLYAQKKGETKLLNFVCKEIPILWREIWYRSVLQNYGDFSFAKSSFKQKGKNNKLWVEDNFHVRFMSRSCRDIAYIYIYAKNRDTNSAPEKNHWNENCSVNYKSHEGSGEGVLRLSKCVLCVLSCHNNVYFPFIFLFVPKL